MALLASIVPGVACAQSETPVEPLPPPGADGSLRVLFIGNSLTYFNDLPGMLRELLRQEGLDVVTASLAEPNFGLEDHWVRRATHDRIAEGWDVVIMQQGPSATEGRPSLLEFAERFARPIREAGATPALYMVWPAEARSFDFQGVSNSYAAAADGVEGLLFPAGEAWLDAWELDEKIALYGGDRFHPSPLGSFLAALVMYEQLTGADARELTSDIPGFEGIATVAELQTLRQAAHRANLDHRRAHCYFQQDVEYTLEARLDEDRDVVVGAGVLTYHNNSSQSLDSLYFHLYLSAFRPNSAWETTPSAAACATTTGASHSST